MLSVGLKCGFHCEHLSNTTKLCVRLLQLAKIQVDLDCHNHNIYEFVTGVFIKMLVTALSLSLSTELLHFVRVLSVRSTYNVV